ncbi:hypothetical protein VTN00DRAFT_8804 [Thermoascus crustaceus]|uniref:uncharacterized protein n=1 Tax=Thermoascus crustaceus TaxID=5088 RepID=UPI0037448A14
MADIIRTSPLRPVVRMRPSKPRSRSRSTSRSPERKSHFRYHELDPLLSNLSPESTLRALTSVDAVPKTEKVAQDLLTKSISQVSTADRALGIRAAVAAQKLKQWYKEVLEWQWPKGTGARMGKGFIPPSHSTASQTECATSQVEYLGSLPAEVVQRYEARIEEIRDAMDGLDVEELKEHVLNFHVPGRSRPSSSASTLSVGPPSFSYVQLSDFNAVITATILRLLPVLSRLNFLLNTWDVRLLVLRQIPGLLMGLKTTRAALDSSMATLQAGEDAALFSMLTFRAKRAELEKMVVSAGKNMDRILDVLDGREDCLPDGWIDDLEAIEADFGTWVVGAERRVVENEWRRLEQRPKTRKSPETPQHQQTEGGLRNTKEFAANAYATQENGELSTQLVDEKHQPAPEAASRDLTHAAGEDADPAAVGKSGVASDRQESCATALSSKPTLDGVSEAVETAISSSRQPKPSVDESEVRTTSSTEGRSSTESDTTQNGQLFSSHPPEISSISVAHGNEQNPAEIRRDADISSPPVVVPAERAPLDPIIENEPEDNGSVSAAEAGKLEEKSSESGGESSDISSGTDTPSSVSPDAAESQVDISSKEPSVSAEVTEAAPLPESNVSVAEVDDLEKDPSVDPADESSDIIREADTPTSMSPNPPGSSVDETSTIREPPAGFAIVKPAPLPHSSVTKTEDTEPTVPERSEARGLSTGNSPKGKDALTDESFEHDRNAPSDVRPRSDQTVVMGERPPRHRDPGSPIELSKPRPQPPADFKHSSNISTTGSLTSYPSPVSTPGIRDAYTATSHGSPLVVDPTTPLQTDYLPSGRARTNSDHTLRKERLLRLESQNGSTGSPFKHSRAASLPLQRFINEEIDSSYGEGVDFLPENIPELRRPSIGLVEGASNDDPRSSTSTPNAISCSPTKRHPVAQRSSLHYVETLTPDRGARDESPALEPEPLKISKTRLSPAVSAGTSALDTPPVPLRSSKRLSPSPSISGLGWKYQDGETATESTTQRKQQRPSSLRPENVRPVSSSKSADDELDERISSILTTIPARIHLGPAPALDPDQRSVASSISPHKNDRLSSASSHLTPSRSSTPTPSLTLTPAFSTRSRHSHSRTPEEGSVRLYHLHRGGKSRPTKLFVRAVGADGERVMVRVGGGWADLGEYLREYALHHGRRGVPEGTVEVQGLPSRGSSTFSSPTTALFPSTNNGRATPLSRPASAIGRRPSSSLGIPQPRRVSLTPEPADMMAAESPSPHSTTSMDRRLSVSSNNSGGGSAVGDSPPSYSTPLGLAGPKPRSRRVSMSPESEAWVEDVLGQARKTSRHAKVGGPSRECTVGKEQKPRSVSDIGTAGLNKRVLLRGLSKR